MEWQNEQTGTTPATQPLMLIITPNFLLFSFLVLLNTLNQNILLSQIVFLFEIFSHTIEQSSVVKY